MDLMTLYSMSEKLGISYVTAVVITGLSVVFLALVILIIFVWAFGKIFTLKNKKSVPKEAPKQPQAKPVPAPAAPAVPAENNQDEIIAVISAAVAAIGQAEGKTYKVKSVRAVKNKPSRSAWSLAGLQNDTTPF
ncbi:OadG family protein [Porcipelethomonas sp.]|uniref:OadG family protein n=1 Tax=Porcipelethomonas sp. TaxID=2981675 RepID=UPI003EF95E99